MGDIICRICGEPWDAYGVFRGDLTREERRAFLNGKGCPCCKGKPPKNLTSKEARDIEEEFYDSVLEGILE